MSEVDSIKQDGLAKIADSYVESVLSFYDNGSFTVFEHKGKTYGGISQKMTLFGERLLVRVIKIAQPISKNLSDLLIERANPSKIIRVDSSIDFENRNLFYAHFDGEKLDRLTLEEQRYLVDNQLF